MRVARVFPACNLTVTERADGMGKLQLATPTGAGCGRARRPCTIVSVATGCRLRYRFLM